MGTLVFQGLLRLVALMDVAHPLCLIVHYVAAALTRTQAWRVTARIPRFRQSLQRVY
jgi:hypothetical protein